jgi:cellulose synthase operon protein B
MMPFKFYRIVSFIQLVAFCQLSLFPLISIAKNEPLNASPDQFITVKSPSLKDYNIPLRLLGAPTPISLKGSNDQFEIGFNFHIDELVSKAELQLAYSYSKALLNELSQIDILVNGQLVDSLSVDSSQGDKVLKKTIVIPAQLIADKNTIKFQFNGHYAAECEDPKDSRLWAIIDNASSLKLSVNRFRLKNNLNHFPSPYIDDQSMRKGKLPFSFVGNVDRNTLEAAGLLASYLGTSEFGSHQSEALFNELPKSGHGIIFVSDLKELSSLGINFPEDVGILEIENPKDPYGKLMIFNSKNGTSAKINVANLIQNIGKLDTDRINFTQAPKLSKSEPYDTRAWISAKKPLKFSEIIPSGDDLGSSGYGDSRIPLSFELPPDLFGLTYKDGVNFNLKYQYTALEKNPNAQLIIYDEKKFIKQIPLFPIENQGSSKLVQGLLGKSSTLPTKIDNNTFQSQTTFTTALNNQINSVQLRNYFNYDTQPILNCAEAPLQSNLYKQSIDPNSTVDISHLSHFIKMPNLYAFSQKGFPFSIMADLSDSALIIPSSPNQDEISAYLNVLGFLGSTVKSPAFNMSLRLDNDFKDVENKNLIYIGMNSDSLLYKSWKLEKYLSGFYSGASQQDLLSKMKSFLKYFQPESNNHSLENHGKAAFLIGLKSPYSSQKSIVVLASKDSSNLKKISEALNEKASKGVFVQGSIAEFINGSINSADVSETYYVGKLKPFESIFWYFKNHPITLTGLTFFALFIVSLIFYFALRANVKKRVLHHH